MRAKGSEYFTSFQIKDVQHQIEMKDQDMGVMRGEMKKVANDLEEAKQEAERAYAEQLLLRAEMNMLVCLPVR